MSQGTFTLYSQGCCGSGQMVECLKGVGLKRTAPKGRENFNNAHTRFPSKSFEGKILFMYADPRDIVLSSLNNSENNNWIHSHCYYLGGDYKYFDPYGKTTIEQILESGQDPFKLKEHFINWLTIKIDYDLMMLKYEALEDPKIYKQVLKFFGVDGDYDYNWRPRKSSYLNLPEEQQLQITELFQDLLKIQSQLPSCHMRWK